MTILMPHQLQAVAAAMDALPKYGGFYVAAGVGSGKSLTAIAIARLLKAQRVLVLAGPVLAVGVWRMELEKWWGPRTVSICQGPWVEFGRRAYQPAPEPAVEVLNLDKLTPAAVKDLVRWKADLVILDEAHYCKSPSAQRTRRVWKVVASAAHAVLLSGTPTHNILDYWAQYRMIDPQHPLWKQTYGAYKKQVAKWKGPDQNWFDGPLPGAQEQIAHIVAPYTHWFDTKDMHLPEPVYTEVPVTLYPDERRVYEAMDREFRAEVVDHGFTRASTVLVKALRLHQLSSGHATVETEQPVGDDGYPDDVETRPSSYVVWSKKSAKLEALLEVLAERAHQKVIVVCRFVSEIEKIQEALGRAVPYIHGGVPEAARSEIIARFQESPEPELLLIQPRSGGISATLTAADCMIFYSLEPSSIVFRQTIGRVWRKGQTGHVQILTLTAENTVDQKLYRGLLAGLDQNDLAKYVMGK